MNNRINELFGEALDVAVPETWTTLDPDQLSRLKHEFAELIVEECLNLVDRGGEFVSRPKLIERIKEHFGVEL